MWDLTHALTEEIGDPDLFVGRKLEMARLMEWAAGTKRRISKSMGILSRRKKGQDGAAPALLQHPLHPKRPFYYRLPEEHLSKTSFAKRFYRLLLSQYFAFTTRTPELVERVLPLSELKELAASDRHVAADIRSMEDILESSPARPGSMPARPVTGSRR